MAALKNTSHFYIHYRKWSFSLQSHKTSSVNCRHHFNLRPPPPSPVSNTLLLLLLLLILFPPHLLPLCLCTDWWWYRLLLNGCRNSFADLLVLHQSWSPSLAPSLHCPSFYGGPYCTVPTTFYWARSCDGWLLWWIPWLLSLIFNLYSLCWNNKWEPLWCMGSSPCMQGTEFRF